MQMSYRMQIVNKKEAFSLTESLYRIIEFYERFVLFLERMEEGTSRNETLRALTA